jgi:hypothetical protein
LGHRMIEPPGIDKVALAILLIATIQLALVIAF